MVRSRILLNRLVWALGSSKAPTSRRRDRRAAPVLDSLEQRLVLSHFGHHGHFLAAHLAATTQVAQTTPTSTTVAAASTTSTGTTAAAAAGTTTAAATNTNSNGCTGVNGTTQDAQLTTDLQKLRTDTNSAIAGSAVTDAQRLALRNDFRTIENAGVTVDRTALKTVADNLLTDLANGTYDSSADTAASIKTAFTAAFTGTALNQTQIDQAYTDFVAVARGLNLSTPTLTTLAADRTAIQADLTRLGIGTTDGGDLGHAQSSNLDLILGGLGFGHDFGHGGGPFGGGGHRGGRF